MKIKRYKIYTKNNDILPVVCVEEPYSFRSKRKYIGKRAKREAILRLMGEELPLDATTNQVNDFIAENIFKTPKMNRYRELLQEVSLEKIILEDVFIYVYDIDIILHENVEFDNPILNFEIVNLLMKNISTSLIIKEIHYVK